MERGTTLSEASRQCNVPKSTLSLKSRDSCKTKIFRPGPKAILCAEDENKIVTWILERFDAKCPVTRTILLDNVKLYLDISKRTTPFKDNRPGRHWFENFVKRHPEISERVSQNLSDARNKATEGKIRAWFAEVRKYLELKNLIDIDPSRVFNCDESAFFVNPSGDRVLARRGSKAIHKVIDGNDKETLTVLYTVNAAGDIAPPMILYWYSRIPYDVSSQIPKEWSFGCTEKGWMTSKSFYEYIGNVFYPWLLKTKVKLPIILYLDGHSSHLTIPLSEFCRNKGIEVIALPPNATHILQPLDVGCFAPLKKHWKQARNEWKYHHSDVRFKKSDFAPLLKKTTDSMDFQSIAKNAFRVCGLFPLDPNAVPYNELNIDKESGHNKEGESDVNDEKEECRKHFAFFEKLLSTDILSSFKEYEKLGLQSLSIDNGNDGLYKYWLTVKQLAGETEVCDTSRNSETVDSSGIDTSASGLFDITLPINPDETNLFLDPGNTSETIEIIEIPYSSSEIFPNSLTENAIIEESIQVSSELTPQNIQNDRNSINISNKENLQAHDVFYEKDIGYDEFDRKDVGNEDGSLFKEIFVWPTEPKTSRKQRQTEKIPSVVTSDEWNRYQKKKQDEKLSKQKELQDKREARKRVQKEKAEEKAKKKRISDNKKTDEKRAECSCQTKVEQSSQL